MGGGNWDTSAYKSAQTSRQVSGQADFGYDEEVRRGRASGVHPELDPRQIVKSITGVRESRDSAEHPNSVPIKIDFDVTGSMREIPEVMQRKLPKLMDTILESTSVRDPQILMGAIGDWHSDRYPVQVGQFESDNRFDEQLRNIILEGNGGGQGMESYGHSFYQANNLTATDAWEKRGKKGYLFTIGDERFWPELSAAELNDIYDVGAESAEQVSDLIAKAKERWEIFHIVPMQSYHGQRNVSFWREYLGERVIELDDMDLVCETIAGAIGMMESAHQVNQTVSDIGLTGDAGRSLAQALSGLVSEKASA